jgi:CDP-2,3-bis-(O-geranylgeranyl)-sn-glycerol synthase
MGGDLFSSFVKRRLNLAPSSMAIGLDQIPESLAPLVAVRLLAPLTTLDIVVATAIFFVGELLLSRLLYQLNIREKPY